jgi:hypothetical protein
MWWAGNRRRRKTDNFLSSALTKLVVAQLVLKLPGFYGTLDVLSRKFPNF